LFNVGIKKPRTKSITGKDLPSARTVSYTMFPNCDVDDPIWTLVTMQYGQVIAHDMALVSGTTQMSTFYNFYYTLCNKKVVTR